MRRWVVHKNLEFEADKINAGLAVSPWSGHRQFAYDLVSFQKPKRILELGTHYGCSFFSFLQACKDEGLDTEVIAVDCWTGDEQAGFYGDEVISTVKKTVNTFFPEQNCRLIQKYFSEALADVEEESIDLLHIDGLHTYEAVSEDFHSWLCKLSPDGVVLFHDVASELGYGTNRFWDEVTVQYPHYYFFPHSWGLGVLFPKKQTYYSLFEENNMGDKIPFYEYKARYELEHRQLMDHIKMVEERDQLIKKDEQMIRERDETIKRNELMIQERDRTIASDEEMIRERDETIKRNEQMIQERDRTIASDEEMIRERDRIIKKNELMLAEKDEAIASDEKMIKERDEIIRKSEEMIRERDKAIHSDEAMIYARDEAIKSNERMIKERDELIRQMETIISKQNLEK